MAWYSKDYSYPVSRGNFPHRLKDENGKSYTGENAFNNRHKLGWVDVPNPPDQFNYATHELLWMGDVWSVNERSPSEAEQANTEFWQSVRETRDSILYGTDWTQVVSSNTVINDIIVSSNSNKCTFSMTSNNATILVDDVVSFGSVTGAVTDVYMVTPDFDEEANSQPNDIVTVQAQMKEHIANGSIINFTGSRIKYGEEIGDPTETEEINFAGVIETTTIDSNLIEGVGAGYNIVSGSSTGEITKLLSNTTAHIFRVPVQTDIVEGATITFNYDDITFEGTVDSVTSSTAYGHKGSFLHADESAAYATYRQELRDITDTYSANVESFVWPSVL